MDTAAKQEICKKPQVLSNKTVLLKLFFEILLAGAREKESISS